MLTQTFLSLTPAARARVGLHLATPGFVLIGVVAASLVWPSVVFAAARQRPAAEVKQNAPEAAPSTFAPLPPEHVLASIWNDPEFARRLAGSYGFLSEAEPRLTPEEQQFYNEKVKPLLQSDRIKLIGVLQSRIKPESSAQFDYLLGTLHFESGEFTNAVRHFERALTKFPDFRRAQKNLAFALVRDGKYAEAIKPLIRTIALGGGDGKVFGLLGFAYVNQERFASAEGAYRQALVFEPDNVDFTLGLVKCALATANYDHAAALLSELIEQWPERESLWTLQANVYIQKEQPAKAAVSLEMLRRMGKAAPQNLFLLGDLYLAQDSRDLALASYLEAIEKDDGQNLAKGLRAAQILVSRGAWNEARPLFAKLRATGGQRLTAADELKLLKLEARAAMASGQGDQGIATLEQIILKDPLDAEALLLSGDYYARHEQPEKAEFRYDAASKLEGFEAEALVKQAQLLVQGRKYVRAVEVLKRAQKVKPRDNVQRYLEKVEQLAVAGRS